MRRKPGRSRALAEAARNRFELWKASQPPEAAGELGLLDLGGFELPGLDALPDLPGLDEWPDLPGLLTLADLEEDVSRALASISSPAPKGSLETG